MGVTKPYKLKRFAAMDVTKPVLGLGPWTSWGFLRVLGNPGGLPGLPGGSPQLYFLRRKGGGPLGGPSAALSGPLAFSDSEILAFGLGPETRQIRPRRAGLQPPGPGETFVLPWMGRRLQPRVGGPGGGPVLAP